jgi:hypothetical protein
VLQGSGKLQQQVTYATVKDAIVQYIQKNYKFGDDIADSLEKMQLKDLSADKPMRTISAEADEDTS